VKMADKTESLEVFLRKAADFLSMFPEYRDTSDSLRQLATSCVQPFNLAVAGRMKTGKSTLINGIIGRELAISGVEETTATLNWICYGTGQQCEQFIVNWKDGRVETCQLASLKEDWSGKSPDVLKRVAETAHLRLFADAEKLREIQIVDTPGTGSAVEEHDTAGEFLNPRAIMESIAHAGKADAIVYVINPIGRKTDAELLNSLAAGRLPGSDPYNIVCVLHMWDSLEVDDPRQNAIEKSHLLRKQLGNLIADVIPVSGPLALAAHSVTESMWEELVELVGQDDLSDALECSAFWDEDNRRKRLRDAFALPWSSFKSLVKLLARERPARVSDAIALCLEYSGIKHLDDFLQKCFFAQSTVIKQLHILQSTASKLDPILRKLGAESRRLHGEARMANAAKDMVSDMSSDIKAWLAQIAGDFDTRACALEKDVVALDREWQCHARKIEGLHLDLLTCKALDEQPAWFDEPDRNKISAVCNHLSSPITRATLGEGKIVSIHMVQALIDRYRAKESVARREQREIYHHIVNRLEEAADILTS
jgi:hypothetical protein